jgi:hypothetical protein
VQRTFHILRASLILLSLLFAFASSMLWIRSRRVTDTLNLTPFPTNWSLFTKSGTLYLTRDRPWLEPAELRQGIKPPLYDHSFLGFGGTGTQEVRTWQAESGRTIPYSTNLRTYFIPLWFCCALFSVAPLIHFVHLARAIRRRVLNLCPNCGYDLRASPTKCPECGATVQTIKKQKIPLPKPC